MTLRATVSYQVIDKGRNATGYDLANDFNGVTTLEDLLRFTKKALITISKDVLKEEQDRGFDKSPVVVVDNRVNKKEEDVNPLGKIEYIARYQFAEIIRDTYKQILYRSPVKTGRYFKNNLVTFNGVQVASNPQELEAWLKTKTTFEDKDIVRFVNAVPYARRLENMGITRQKRQPKTATRKKKRSKQTVIVPNGAYHIAFLNVRRRFRKNIFVAFDWLPGDQLGLLKTKEDYEKLTFKHGKRDADIGRPYIYPTIIIRAFGSGISDTGRLLQ